MTTNDAGHVNNLDRTQTDALKDAWITLIDAISKEASIPVDQIAGSTHGDDLFLATGYENPDVALLRWLRARKWDVNAAVQQLMGTLKWRREWGVDKLIAKGETELNHQEIMIGKTYLMGYDKAGRPISYVHIRDHIKDQFPAEVTESLTIFLIETGRKLLNESIETCTAVIDMAGLSVQNIDYPLVKFFIHLLENHYPESLGIALVINASFLFYTTWNVVKYWLDPVVKSKIHVLRSEADLTEFIDPSNLPRRFGGTQPDFKYTPPTAEDHAMLNDFRADKQGKRSARTVYRRAARHYLNVTLKWAHGHDNQTLVAERTEARKQLRDAFEQLVPYIHTRTHYHRIGLIHEPIYDIAYEKLRLRNELKIVEF